MNVSKISFHTYLPCNLSLWQTVHYQRPGSVWTLLLPLPSGVIHPSFLFCHWQLSFHSLSLDDPHFLQPCRNKLGHTSIHSLGLLLSGHPKLWMDVWKKCSQLYYNCWTKLSNEAHLLLFSSMQGVWYVETLYLCYCSKACIITQQL